MALPPFGGAAGSILTGLTAVAMLSLQLAYAHGPAEWIQRGGFKNAAGELCCGERDCFELTDADVKITSAGYYVVSITETSPCSEATPSPDGRYWRCRGFHPYRPYSGGNGLIATRVRPRPGRVDPARRFQECGW